jgi:enoyl-CoA hydratase/carnithine racemase
VTLVTAPTGDALVVVDLDGTDPVEYPPLSPLAPVVTVGIAVSPVPNPPPFDVLLTNATDPPAPWVCAPVDEVADAVRCSPMASVTLVHVLRTTASMPAGAGLVVESLAYSTLQAGPEFQAWLASSARPAPKHSDEPAVLLSRDGDELTITLNRPAARNAFNVEVRDGLVAAFELVAADQSITRAHLHGAGPAFCSGGDLSEFGTAPNPLTAHLVRTSRSAAAALHGCADRVTAHVHGACVGAGTELPAFAGTVIADRSARFRLPEVAMGLIPGAGGTVSIPRCIGRERTAYLALTGATIDATTAQAWGLVDAIVDTV